MAAIVCTCSYDAVAQYPAVVLVDYFARSFMRSAARTSRSLARSLAHRLVAQMGWRQSRHQRRARSRAQTVPGATRCCRARRCVCLSARADRAATCASTVPSNASLRVAARAPPIRSSTSSSSTALRRRLITSSSPRRRRRRARCWRTTTPPPCARSATRWRCVDARRDRSSHSPSSTQTFKAESSLTVCHRDARLMPVRVCARRSRAPTLSDPISACSAIVRSGAQ